MATPQLTVVIDELYALTPDEFTAARNARASEVKARDRELAARIGGLKKPSPAAWIVNRLVREEADSIDGLVGLGAELREAQASGDGRALTTLGAERRRTVAVLLGEANRLADAAGRPPSRAVLDEVEQTLIAATVDQAAGAALRSGRLVRSLQAVGFEDVDLDGAVAGGASAVHRTERATGRPARATAGPGETAGGSATAERERAERASVERERERAEREVRDARDRAAQAQRALVEAEDLLHAAEWNADELRDERHDLETRLKALRSEIAEAERDERDADRVRAKAATTADRARDDVEAAEAALRGAG